LGDGPNEGAGRNRRKVPGHDGTAKKKGKKSRKSISVIPEALQQKRGGRYHMTKGGTSPEKKWGYKTHLGSKGRKTEAKIDQNKGSSKREAPHLVGLKGVEWDPQHAGRYHLFNRMGGDMQKRKQ